MPEPAAPRGLEARLGIEVGRFRLDAQLMVEPGTVLAVVGPNGAGKTSLLRALAGLLPLANGRIVVDGEPLADADRQLHVPPAERKVGVVFQDYRLFPHLSAVDNVAFGARARGSGTTRARLEATAWLERMGLQDAAGRRPRQLSGGQAQRVALARALVGRPRLLLLDEPLAALDARTRLEIRSELRRHLLEFGGPSVVVTHDPLEALVLADRILVLEPDSEPGTRFGSERELHDRGGFLDRGGSGGHAGVVRSRAVQQGTPAEIARRPATDYVARLVGLNLYAGELVATGPQPGGAGDSKVRLDSGGTLTAAGTTGLEVPHAGEGRVLVAVAPSAISLHAHHPGPGSPRNVWQGVVEGMELLTDRVRVSVQGEPPALVDITAAAVTELHLAPGQRVWLSAKATEVLAYPR